MINKNSSNKYNIDDTPIHKKKYYAKKLNEQRVRTNLLLISFFVFGVIIILFENNKTILNLLFYIVVVFDGYLIIRSIMFKCPRCSRHLRRIRGWSPDKCWYCGLPLSYQCKESEGQIKYSHRYRRAAKKGDIFSAAGKKRQRTRPGCRVQQCSITAQAVNKKNGTKVYHEATEN